MPPEPTPLSERIATAADWIKNAQHLVVFTGAGISTESGIPDYRGPNGVWTRRDKGLPPPQMNKRWSEVEPNAGHQAIFQLYQRGILKFLISQNVDNLHLKSGIPMNIIAELHGNSTLMHCLQCDTQIPKEGLWDENLWGKGYRTDPIRKGQPKCPKCGGRIISAVVNFKDPMPEKEMGLSYYHSKNADVYLVVGSSLSVVPAAHMPREAKQNGAKLIIINHMETGMDDLADLRFHENAGDILTRILRLL